MNFPWILAFFLAIAISGGAGAACWKYKGLSIPISAAVGGGTLVVSLIVIRLLFRRRYFMQTERLKFSTWRARDLKLALKLWTDPQVTHYIYAHTPTAKDVEQRLNREIEIQEKHKIQYWPIFFRATGELVGCCGLRPCADPETAVTLPEFGVHLLPKFWHKGLAQEAANAVFKYAFETLKCNSLFAGHHPHNKASEVMLLKLGFDFTGSRFYQPTGLMHPSYILTESGWKSGVKFKVPVHPSGGRSPSMQTPAATVRTSSPGRTLSPPRTPRSRTSSPPRKSQ